MPQRVKGEFERVNWNGKGIHITTHDPEEGFIFIPLEVEKVKGWVKKP